MMEPLTLGFGAALLLGLVFGAGPCNVTCLPFLGPVFLAGADARATVAVFSAGRMVGYAALGGAAGALGHALQPWLATGMAGWVLGGAAVLLGVLMWSRARRGGCRTARPQADEAPLRPVQRVSHLGLFGMGVGMALNPCAPLGTVLLAAAASGAIATGLGLGLAFGAGAVLVPALVFGLLVAHFGRQVRAHLAAHRGRLERGAAMMLILMGVLTASGWVRV